MTPADAVKALERADEKLAQAQATRDHARRELDHVLAQAGWHRAAAISSNALYESPIAPGVLVPLDDVMRAVALQAA